MRARFPLYLKIVCWFLLNLALLACAALWLFRSQLGFGLDALLKGASGEKIASAVQLINDKLRDAGPDGWEAELERFSEAFGVTFSLFRSSGEFVLGPDEVIPSELRDEIVKHLLPPPANRRGGPRGGEEQRRGERPPPQREMGAEGRVPHIARQPTPLFLTKTKQPPKLWLGARVHVGGRGAPPAAQSVPPDRRGRRTPPDILIAKIDRLSGNNLLPDLRPWIAAGLGIVGLSVLFWIPFVRGITRSLRQIRDATESVAAGDFGTHVSESRSDELGQLGSAINRMSDRLHAYVSGQRRFLGDIAHELCSPIARMQMALGVLEQRTTEEQRPRVERVREELEHMADMVNELLSFSKASLLPQSTEREVVALGPLINDIARRETGGGDTEIGIEEASGLSVLADQNLLGRALGNLLRNSLRYAGEDGPISIDAAPAAAGKVIIKVSDCGPGIPEEDVDQILDPFYRPGAAREREAGGVGLGLAIVNTCVQACGGTVSCRNTNPGFQVTLELDAAPAVI